MNKTIIIPILVIVIAGLSLFLINNTNNTSTQDQTFSEQGRKMSFEQFLKQDKGSYQCMVSQYIDETMTQTTDGLVFLHEGMIRGDFLTQVSGIEIASSVLVRDGFLYSWTSMAPFGVRTPVEAGQDTSRENTVTDQGGAYTWNASQIGDYECAPWEVDISTFDVPEAITFRTL